MKDNLTKEQAKILREKFKNWREDWDDPSMDIYDVKPPKK